MKDFFYCLAFLTAFVSPYLYGQDSGRSESNLLGDWRGTSVCQVRESTCRDEDSLYHLARIAETPNRYSMKGDKIVDGKAISMGTVECRYNEVASDLTCDLPRGVLRFTVHGNKMEGTVTLPDGTVWRKLALTKAASARMSG